MKCACNPMAPPLGALIDISPTFERFRDDLALAFGNLGAFVGFGGSSGRMYRFLDAPSCNVVSRREEHTGWPDLSMYPARVR